MKTEQKPRFHGRNRQEMRRITHCCGQNRRFVDFGRATMSRSANSGQVVYDTVMDLTNTGRRAHRETIQQVTGLRMSVVDEVLKRLTASERLRRIERGVYTPIIPPREDRAVSSTMLPDGTCKVEIGEEVISLTLREARHLAMLIGGIPLVFAATGGR